MYMNLSTMTFHESYGSLPKNLLRLMRNRNVSPLDYDLILNAFGWTWDSPGIDFARVYEFIEASSTDGIYRSPRYL